MHGNLGILLKRVDRTLDERIRPAVTTHLSDFTVKSWEVPGNDETPGEPISFMQALEHESEFQPISIGSAWGKAWGTTWLQLSLTTEQREHLAQLTQQLNQSALPHRVEYSLDLGWKDHSPGFQSEGLVRLRNGEIIKAVNPKNRWVPAIPEVMKGESLFVEAASNPLLLDVHPFLPTEEGDILTSSREQIYTLSQASVVATYTEVEALAYDLEVLHSLASNTENSSSAWEIALAMGRALDKLDLQHIPETAQSARAELKTVLEQPATASAQRMTVVGHAHIDSAWLWPLRETRRKVKRTLSNVCRLLDDGAEMIFAFPAAQHAAWILEDEPELFARIKEHVQAGRIVPVGSMWVEPDAVMPGGESLCRQLLEGMKFYRDNLGVKCSEIWLPDSFGYSAALPQIARLAGIGSFLTQKISWNQHNRFPHHTLWWEGLDGSRIFTHFPPVDTYGAEITARELLHAENNFKDKGNTNLSLVPYGYGDGGGGPTRDMLERIKRFSNLNGVGKLEHRPPREFFKEAREQYPNAPTWAGELYLEYHRGTFTSQGHVKEAVRQCEYKLRAAEFLATQAALTTDFEYPYQDFQALWRNLCLTQFHDILPGTSIKWVYREVETLHQQIKEATQKISLAAAQKLVGEGTENFAFNTAPITTVRDSKKVLPYSGYQVSLDENTEEIIETWDHPDQVVLSAENSSITIGSDGSISSYHGSDGREVVPPQMPLGQLQIFQDFPNMWDAWDIDYFYRGSEEIIGTGELVSATQYSDHAEAKVSWVFGKSQVEALWTLTADYLDVSLSVQWHEEEKLLKVCFPIDVHTDHAQFETQFGHVTRATHENTSWDFFRFEVPCHRWLHVGDNSWGVGIANSRTYGWDVTRHPQSGGGTYQLVRASLLRAPKYPDPRTDIGNHSFSFRITPGAGISETVRSGYEMNTEDIPIRGGRLPEPLFSLVGGVCESVQMAPDESGDVLLRIYESTGSRQHMSLRADWANRIYCTDLFGEEGTADAYNAQQPVSQNGMRNSEGVFERDLRAFEIVTVRVEVSK